MEKADIENSIILQEVSSKEMADDTGTTPLVKAKKPRKPMTAGQLANLAIQREKLAANHARKRAEKILAAETLLGKKKAAPVQVENKENIKPVVTRYPSPVPVPSSSDEEEIIVQKKVKKVKEVVSPKKVKRTRKVIIYEESTTDEDEEQMEQEMEEGYEYSPPAPVPYKSRQMNTQQNSKSKIMHSNKIQATRNFFCD